MEAIYLPVPTQEQLRFARQFSDGLRNAAGDRPAAPPVLRNASMSGNMKGLRRFFGKGCLSGLTAQDRLYVIIHGDTNEMGANRGADGAEDWKMYSPARLARAIKKEGLPAAFIDLQIVACQSAEEHDGGASVAERIYLALRGSHQHIIVTGFLGPVGVSPFGAENSVRVAGEPRSLSHASQRFPRTAPPLPQRRLEWG